jgi:hypothetical protein
MDWLEERLIAITRSKALGNNCFVAFLSFLESGSDNCHLVPLVMFTKLLRIFVWCLEEENLELLEELRQELKQVEMRRPKQWRT